MNEWIYDFYSLHVRYHIKYHKSLFNLYNDSKKDYLLFIYKVWQIVFSKYGHNNLSYSILSYLTMWFWHLFYWKVPSFLICLDLWLWHKSHYVTSQGRSRKVIQLLPAFSLVPCSWNWPHAEEVQAEHGEGTCRCLRQQLHLSAVYRSLLVLPPPG